MVMWRVLAIAALVATVRAGHGIPEYSKAAYENLGLVEVHNFMAPESEPGKVQEDCGIFYGIHLPDKNQAFCNLFAFRFDQVELKPEKTQALYMQLQFGTPNVPRLLLDIPIFQRPAEYLQAKENGEDAASKWADDNQVGDSLHMGSQLLLQVENNKPISFVSFEWLDEVLQYGIILEESGIEVPRPYYRYLTRPVIMSEKVIDMLTKIIETVGRH